ncbi:uncharacterized protein Z519_10678 [Cladophialophora bantiana CBS 173.52]|uniref:Methyltransferase type 11 domain-containing protein n=1 Tax=Cladophialophora bantiana (strain ATCC 10958 / CBS 173.52 / CDC B-1940 / NIH 8579) TaxID=1442370 RepID=A0A0D2FPU2_CLAB1|nr:uncharacterized protein Z519_10678 [Cladophialophora bantiana CBS 173.52]KIW88632.1 hypothetical protein Z519_10678 [Cladophialophora bantiana CBS 173.52]
MAYIGLIRSSSLIKELRFSPQYPASTPLIILKAWSKALQRQVRPRVADSQALDFEDDFFDLDIVNFSIANFTNAELAIKETYRTLKPDRTAIVSNWETFGFATVLDAAMRKVRPNAGQMPVAGPEFMRKGALVRTLASAGFEKDKIQVYQTKIVVSDDEGLAGISDFMNGLYLGVVALTLSDDEKRESPGAVAKTIEEAKVVGGEVLCQAWVPAAFK